MRETTERVRGMLSAFSEISFASGCLRSQAVSDSPPTKVEGSSSLQEEDLIRTPFTDETRLDTLLERRPYPSENEVRVTKLITSTVSESRVRRNLNLRLIRLLFAMLNIGVRMLRMLTRPSLNATPMRRGKKAANAKMPMNERAAKTTKLSLGTMLLPG